MCLTLSSNHPVFFHSSRSSSRPSPSRGSAYLWLRAAFLVGFIVFIYTLQRLPNSDPLVPNSSSSTDLLRSLSDQTASESEGAY